MPREINRQRNERTFIRTALGTMDFTDGHTANKVQKLCEDSNSNFPQDLFDLRM